MSHIRDSKDWCGREDVLEAFKSFLLESSSNPRLSFTSEQVKGGNDVGEVWDEFPVKVCKPSERPDPFD